MVDKREAKTLVILQSNYIPWKGYFDLIAAADEFIIFDEVQYTKNDWRNRNRIILNDKPHWLTIPVRTANKLGAAITEVEVSNADWARSHWATIVQAYRRAPHFSEIAATLEPLYKSMENVSRLTEINEAFLRHISRLLSLDCRFVRSSEVPRTTADPTGRLVEICKARGATVYVSGPAAMAYIDLSLFEAAQVRLAYANYDGYAVYDQGTTNFEHGVSMVDLLFRLGQDARGQLKTVNRRVPLF